MVDDYAIENAEIAYSAYAGSVGWRDCNGEEMPRRFDRLPECQRIAWIAVVEAIEVKVRMGM